MLVAYVCVGVLSAVLLVVSPSPQVISYLFGLPSAVIVNVTTVPAPPDVVSAVKSMFATAVLLIILSIHSLVSSIALDSSVDSDQVLIAPSYHELSSGVPNCKD